MNTGRLQTSYSSAALIPPCGLRRAHCLRRPGTSQGVSSRFSGGVEDERRKGGLGWSGGAEGRGGDCCFQFNYGKTGTACQC